jgi:hypothetical protein
VPVAVAGAAHRRRRPTPAWRSARRRRPPVDTRRPGRERCHRGR